MKTSCAPTPRRRSLWCLLGAAIFWLPVSLSAQTLDWDPSATPGVQGGSGLWDASATNWNDGGGNVAWPDDIATVARLNGAAGTIDVQGSRVAGGLEALTGGYAVDIDVAAAEALVLHGDFTGTASVRMAGSLADFAGGTEGLQAAGGGTVSVSADIAAADASATPVLGASATLQRLTGSLTADGAGNAVQLVTNGGGAVAFAPGLDVSMVTAADTLPRPLQVAGDGTGGLELESGFIADATGGSGLHDGLGAIGLANAFLRTHGSASLPVGNRPDGSGGFQTSGWIAFEDTAGGIWEVATAAQAYVGGVYFAVDGTIDTAADLTHTGVTTFSSAGNYWAENAFQSTSGGITITKTGAADLIFDGEAAFLPGTTLQIDEGGVDFRTDPAAGIRKGSSGATEGGPNLHVQVGKDGVDWRDAHVRFSAPLSRIASLTSTQGTVEILGLVQAATFSSNSQDKEPDTGNPPAKVYTTSFTRFHLDAAHGQIDLTGSAALGGELVLTREPGYEPPVGTIFDIILAPGGLTAGPNGTAPRFESLDDESDLGIEVTYLSDRVRLTTTREASSTGLVIDEDWTDGAFDVPGWSILNSKVSFVSTGRSDPAVALAHDVDVPGFVWNAATIDVPPFRVRDDDVLVIRMVTFSDIAYNNAEFSKPEVACLHNHEHSSFGHDHATELSRNYFTLGGWQQLKPSVENDDNQAFNNIHKVGGDTSASLNTADRSLVLFRPTPGGTNSEGFGNIGMGEKTHVRAMEHFDNILISFPFEYRPNITHIFRNGSSLADAYIGMSEAHVGVTRRTDANLDYATDAIDFIYWNSYRGATSGANLPMGDFDNDGDTDGDDLALWETYKGQRHDPAFNIPQAKTSPADLPGAGTAPSFAYDAASGELTLTTNGTAVSAWAVPAPAALGVNSAPAAGNWWQGRTADKEQWADRALGGFSGSVVIATLPTGLSENDFGEAVFGYANGGGGVVSVMVNGALSPYEQWADSFALIGTDRDPLESPAGDGVSNLVKYGLGLDPNVPSGGEAPYVIVEDGGEEYFALRFTRPSGQTDLTTTGEVSTTLDPNLWSDDPGDVETLIEDNGDGTETVTIRALTPMSSGVRVFLRAVFALP